MNQRLAILLLAIYWVISVLVTHVPAEHVPYVFAWFDKVIHFGVYAGLAILIVNAFGFQRSLALGSRSFLTLVVFLLLYAALDEVTQAFVPGRHPAVSDWFADGIGGTLGVASCWWWSLRRRTAKEEESRHSETPQTQMASAV